YSNEISAERQPSRKDYEALLVLLHPLAPHTTEELWEKLGHKDPLAKQPWPKYDENFLKDSSVEYAVQVNGKVRATFPHRADAPQQEVVDAALALEKVKAAMAGKAPFKTIVVPNRLVNIV